MSDDEIPDPIALLDQALSSMAPVAKLFRAHYDTLMAEACDAMKLTLVMVQVWWSSQLTVSQ